MTFQFSVKNLSGLIVILLMTFMHLQANATDYSSQAMLDAYENYLQVSDENGSAKKLAQQWQQLQQQYPTDPLALAMLGASHTLMGRDAMMPWSKMKHTQTGLDEMARAQRLLSAEHQQQNFAHLTVDLQVKTTAAIIFTQVPSMFGRHEDGLYLFEDVLTDPNFLALPKDTTTYVYYFAIAAAKQLEKSVLVSQWKSELSARKVNDEYSQAALRLE